MLKKREHDEKKTFPTTTHNAKSLTLSHFVNYITDFIPATLIDKKYVSKIEACATLFSSNIEISCLGFECPLNEMRRWCDFHFELFLTPLILDALKKSFSEVHWAQICPWDKVANFFGHWALYESADTGDSNASPRIGLELDTGSNELWPPKPNLFFELPDTNKSTLPIENAFFWVNSEYLADSTLKLIEQCYQNDFNIKYVGIMLARNLNAVRVVCGKKGTVGINDLVSYLNNLKHPSLNDELVKLLIELSDYTDYFLFELDVGEFIYPRIGVNCYIEGKTFNDKKAKWAELLMYLFNKKYINLENKNDLINWMGGCSEWIPRLDFESNESYDTIKMIRDINHVKFNYAVGKPIQHKAYLRAIGIA